jgi:hypothetical protein
LPTISPARIADKAMVHHERELPLHIVLEIGVPEQRQVGEFLGCPLTRYAWYGVHSARVAVRGSKGQISTGSVRRSPAAERAAAAPAVLLPTQRGMLRVALARNKLPRVCRPH